MIIIDASALAPTLMDNDPQGTSLRRLLAHEEIGAPAIIGLEIMSVLRKFQRSGRLSRDQTQFALDQFSRLNIELFHHQAFWSRIWKLQHNVTPYDATYVALAEFLDAPLWTLDQRLAKAPGAECEFVVPSV